jgi:hypothetical protein
MIRERIVVRRPRPSRRRRVPLTVIQRRQVTGLGPCEPWRWPLPLRGLGSLDYVCGSCGHLLEAGVTAAGLATTLLVCGCGAVNQVPQDCAHA